MSDLQLLGPRTASQENNIFMAKRLFYRPERPWEMSSVHPSLTFILEVESFTMKILIEFKHGSFPLFDLALLVIFDH